MATQISLFMLLGCSSTFISCTSRLIYISEDFPGCNGCLWILWMVKTKFETKNSPDIISWLFCSIHWQRLLVLKQQAMITLVESNMFPIGPWELELALLLLKDITSQTFTWFKFRIRSLTHYGTAEPLCIFFSDEHWQCHRLIFKTGDGISRQYFPLLRLNNQTSSILLLLRDIYFLPLWIKLLP